MLGRLAYRKAGEIALVSIDMGHGRSSLLDGLESWLSQALNEPINNRLLVLDPEMCTYEERSS